MDFSLSIKSHLVCIHTLYASVTGRYMDASHLNPCMMSFNIHVSMLLYNVYEGYI